MNFSSDGEKKIFTAQKMVFGGDCLGKIDGKNVFVPYAVPGEKLEVQIERSFKDYDEARITKILEASPRRQLPACPLYQKCGGCNLMHIDYDFQLELKKGILVELMERAGVEIPAVEILAGNPLGYRSRFQLHDGGMEGRASNQVIPIQGCPVAVAQINEWLKETPLSGRPKGKGFLFGHQKAEPSLSFAADFEKKAPPAKAPKKNGGKKKRGDKVPPARFEGISQEAQSPVEIRLLEKSVAFDARGFFQSNIDLLEKAIPLICQGLSGKNALDLYSGAGTFSVFLADAFENVVMVEQSRAALVYAERNMAGKKHASYGISGADFAKRHAEDLSRQIGGFDAAVADPPRAGIEREALDWLCKSGIPVIKYLSCNPSTQARDLKKLQDAGYKVGDLTLLDFYPQTGHLESLATCIKK